MSGYVTRDSSQFCVCLCSVRRNGSVPCLCTTPPHVCLCDVPVPGRSVCTGTSTTRHGDRSPLLSSCVLFSLYEEEPVREAACQPVHSGADCRFRPNGAVDVPVPQPVGQWVCCPQAHRHRGACVVCFVRAQVTSQDVIPQRAVLRLAQMAEQLVDLPQDPPPHDPPELVEEEEEE